MRKPVWFYPWTYPPCRGEVVTGSFAGKLMKCKLHRLSGEWMYLIASDWIGCQAPEKWRRAR